MRTVVVVIGATALIAGCGGSSRAHRSTAELQRLVLANPCIERAGFGGLGASARLFDANNNNSTGPAGPTPGAAWYQVIGTARGCVTGYSVQDSAAPPLRIRDLLGMLSTYLPNDAKLVVTKGGCAIWSSAALARATGLRYATAFAIAQVGSLQPGVARVEATAAARC